MQCISKNHQNDTLRCIIFGFHAWDDVVLTQQPKAVVLQSGALFAWIEEADQNPQIFCHDDPQKAQLAYIWSDTIGKGPYKGIIKTQETRKDGLSETMIDEKPTDGTSTSKKDQDGHGTMKSENFFKGVLYIHSPNPDDELKNFFCQDGHGVMIVHFFSRQSFFPQFF